MADDAQQLAQLLREADARAAGVAEAYKGLPRQLEQSAAAFRAETGAELQWLRQEQAAHQQRMVALEVERAAADAAQKQQLADLEAARRRRSGARAADGGPGSADAAARG